MWIDGRWEQRGGQWHWVPGRWEVVGSGTTTTVTPDGNTTTGPADPNQPGPRVRTVDTHQDQPGGGGGGSMPPPPGIFKIGANGLIMRLQEIGRAHV